MGNCNMKYKDLLDITEIQDSCSKFEKDLDLRITNLPQARINLSKISLSEDIDCLTMYDRHICLDQKVRILAYKQPNTETNTIRKLIQPFFVDMNESLKSIIKATKQNPQIKHNCP